MLDPNERRPLLSFFGGPEVRQVDGTVVPLTPTQEALLALIWGHESAGVTRRHAIGLLWEEDDTARGRHRLSQVLHELRSRIGVRPVEQPSDDVLLPAVEAVRSDMLDFRAALEAGALQRAFAIQDRGFATLLRKIPGEGFEDWLQARRTAWRREVRDAAARTWDAHEPRGAWRGAREAAEVLHILDPGNPDTLRKVIEARAMTGGFEAAEAAFAAHAEDRGGVEHVPPETRSLMDRIRRLAGDRDLGEPRESRAPPPLIGRQKDLETAREALDRVRRGGFEFVLLQGDSGVGKTRLLDEIRKEAHIKGFRCLVARAVELEYRIPLNPLVDALSHPEVGHHLRELEEPWRAVIAQLLPHLPPGMERSEVPPIAEASLARRLYDAFWMLLSKIAEDEPTLLFIDDLQWADATTIAVLQFVQRRWTGGALGVICTMRPDLAADREGTEKYLTGADGLDVTRIEVGDLSPADASALVRTLSDDALDRATTERLCALGGRNPFYLIELTRDHLEGHFSLPELPSDAVIIPISIRQLLDPRLEALSAGAAQALGILAVWGRWTGLEDLAAVADRSVEEMVPRVEELERCRLVVIDRDRVRVAHELFRGAVYHRLSEPRRAMLHRGVAERLLTGEEPQAGELAVHFANAGDSRRAAVYGRRAADAALESGAMPEAAYFLHVVIDNERDEVLRAEATGDLGRVLHMKRDMVRATPMLELAAARLREVGQEGRALRMEIRRIEALAELGTSSIAELRANLNEIKSVARLGEDHVTVALALDAELHLLNRGGHVSAIRELFSEIEDAATHPNPVAECLVNTSLAVRVLFDEVGDPLGAARRAVSLAKRHSLREFLFIALSRLYLVLIRKGQFNSKEARVTLGEATELAKRSGDLALRVQLLMNHGVAEMDSHNLGQAESLFDRATALLGSGDESVSRFKLACNRGELSLMRRDWDAMLTHYITAERELSGGKSPVDSVKVVAAGIGLAALEVGDLTESKRRDLETRELPSDWHFDPFVFLCFRSRLLEAHGKPKAAVALLGEHVTRFAAWMPVLALKLQFVQARSARRARLPEWRLLVDAGVQRSEELGVLEWRRKFDALAR